jgi:hypothetical protein
MSQVSDSEPLRPRTGAADPTSDLDEPASQEPSRAGDDFAWLYRQDGSAAGVTGADPRTLVLPLDSQASNVSSHQPVPLPPPSAPRGRNPMIIMIVILLCLTAGAITGIALLLRSDSGTATAGSAESSVEAPRPLTRLSLNRWDP